jgi:KaiC/GvpD/RAD55 family RecA-like ATPase
LIDLSKSEEISKELDKNSTLLLVFSSDDHSHLDEIIKHLKKKKICFVSLSRTYEIIQKELKELGVDPEKLFVIDAVTATFSRSKAPPNTIFVPSPDALTDLNIAIIETIKDEKCDYLIFDSLSTLLTYQEDHLVARFTDYVITKIKDLKSKAIFTCLKADSEKQAIKEISLHTDKVVRFDEFNGKEKKE